MTDFRLTDSERSHPLWVRLKAHFVDRVAVARARNDDPGLPPDQTAALRGRIACLRAIIALGDDTPLVGEDDFSTGGG